MIYKVYAQCVVRAKSVIVINEKDVNECILDEANSFFDYSNLDFLPHNEDDEIEDSVFNKCYEIVADMLTDIWNKNKRLECGDFMIVEADEAPSRPNMCGSSHADIYKEDIIAKMNIK